MKQRVFAFKEYIRLNGLTGAFLEKEMVSPEAELLYGEEIELSTARNQFVSFQIGVVPESGTLDRLELSFSPLKGEAGEISAACFETSSQWFHQLKGKLIPDLLIPLEKYPFKIPLDERYLPNQKAGALWVDLWIAETVSAGIYTGGVTVKADGETTVFPVSCKVSAWSVPKENKIVADLNNYADSISDSFDSLRSNPERYTDGSYNGVETEFFKMSREHRCLFHNLPYRHSGTIPPNYLPELAGEGKQIHVKSWELFDAHFAPLLDGSAFAGNRGGEYPLEFMYLPFHFGWPADYAKWGQKGYRTEYRRILQEFVNHFEEKGWNATYFEILLNHKKDYRFYPYTVDEIWYEHDQDVVYTYHDIIRDIWDTSSCKFVWRMDSSNHYGNHFDHPFSDMCKMWVAGFTMFDWFPESVEVMREKGNILWVYGGVLQALDESLLAIYMYPIYCMMTGTTGFCVWNTTGFRGDMLQCPVSHGGENLFYPGSYFGIEAPLPSLRLKTLRNAMQLTELAMRTHGTPLKQEMDGCINRIFHREKWFCEKPDFIDTPPRYWEFDESMEKHTLKPLYEDHGPETIETFRRDVLDLLEKSGQEKEQGVVFKFQ